MNSSNLDSSPEIVQPTDPAAMRKGQLSRVRQVTSTLPMDTAWEQLWTEGVAPWDMNGVTPVIAHLLKQNKVRDGQILVPGCGAGHDVVAMASIKRYVVGLDISKTALEQAKELASRSPEVQSVEFLNADFFSYAPPYKFDLIFDYTFFCALEPSLRSKWAAKMAELLALDGEIMTLMFPVDDHEGGPPYSVSVEAYEKVLSPWGFRISSREHDIPSDKSRKGLEILVSWERTNAKV